MQARIQELEERLASYSSAETYSTDKIDVLLELAWEIFLSDSSRAMRLTREAEALAKKLKYERGLAYVLRNLGYAHLANSDFEPALKLSRDALAKFERLKDEFGKSTALDNIALTFWRLGNYDQALKFSLTALGLNKKIGNKRGEAWALHNIAAISLDVGDHEQAIENYCAARKIFEQIDYLVGVGAVLSGLGDVHLKTGKLDHALRYYLQTLELDQRFDIPMAIARTLTEIGSVYERLGDLDRAFEYHNKSVSYFERFESRETKAFALLNLGRLYGQRGDSENALKYLNQALTIIESTKAKPTAYKIRHALFEICESLGDYQKALEHHKAFHQLKEAVYNEEGQTQLRKLQIRAQVERAEKEAEIENLQVVHSEKMNLLENLVAGLTHEINSPLGVIRSHAQISERAIEKLVEEIKKNDRAGGTLNREAIQRLTGILANSSESTANAGNRILDLMEGLKDFASLDRGKRQLVDVQKQLDNTLSLLRSRFAETIEIAKDYKPVPKIKGYARDLNQVFMTLLMNAFDAIGGAGKITLHTAANNGRVEIKIADDGRGIAPERLEKIFEIGFGEKDTKVRMRFGLANTYKIIQQHTGEIDVRSELGKGTEFVIKLPIMA